MLNYLQLVDRPMACHPDRLGLAAALSYAGYGARSSVENDGDDYEIVQNRIAVIPVCGLLRRGGFGASYSTVRANVSRAMADPKIAAIVLNIDSMGGECTDLFPVSDYIYSQRGRKPIYSVCDNAYSAAYVLASAADKIYIPCAAHVGSIGIALAHVDLSKANERQGIRITLVHAGERKILGNPYEPLGDDAKDEMQQECDRLSRMMIDTVARNRGVSPARIASTQAGCYMGEAGVPLLADTVGSLTDCVSDLMDELGIQGRGLYSRLARSKRAIHRLRADTRIEKDLERRKRRLLELREGK